MDLNQDLSLTSRGAHDSNLVIHGSGGGELTGHVGQGLLHPGEHFEEVF